LQACAGAPLVLAAIAHDDVLPFLSWVKPASAEEGPSRAIWFTWLLASLPALAGNLDAITPLVTMFFLLMYAGINLSCFLLGFLKSPGFRPTFKYFHWSASLLGFVWCLALVVLVSPWYMCVSVMVIIMILYLYTKKQQARKDWGDVGNAIRYAVATATLSALSGSSMNDFHAKNWRPQVLTVVDTDDRGNPINLHVVALAKQLKHGGGGIHMVTSIMRSQRGLERYATCELMAKSKRLLEGHMEIKGMQDCFAQSVATTSTTSEAVWSAVVHSGLGPLSPNTVLLPYPTTKRSPEELNDYVLTVRGIMNLKKAVIIFQGTPQYPPRMNEYAIAPPIQTIDLWWVVHDGGLLLLLPYILSQDEAFEKNTKIRLFAVTSSATENPDRLRLAVIEHLARVRIRAMVQIVDLSDTSIADDMRESDESVRLSTLDTTETISTHHLTVGEVFSQEAYEVPYHAVWEDPEIGNAAVHESPMADVAFSPGASAHDHGERMRTARAFNQALRQYSSRASLVVTNMPLIRPNSPPAEFFEYVDAMCSSIDNMMLVRGSGVEVVTTYV
jgi:solute carrier family 12 (potassium/chloride transporter), member 4/6